MTLPLLTLNKKLLWWQQFIKNGYLLFKRPEDFNSLLVVGDLISETFWFSYSIQSFKKQDSLGLMKNRFQVEIPSQEILNSYPADSLGYKYSSFAKNNQLDTYDGPDSKASEQIWLRERSRRIHDLLHVVLNKSTSVKDEILLNGYLAYSLRLPISILIVYGGLFRMLLTEQKAFYQTLKDLKKIKCWCKKHPSLLCQPIEAWIEKPLNQIKSDLGLNLESA